KLSTKPAPTGSAMIGNTIGTVRVSCNKGPTVEVPWARMTSGASAINSDACLRISTVFPPAQRVSIRTLPPAVQPNCCSDCRNVATQVLKYSDRQQLRSGGCQCAVAAPAVLVPRAAKPPHPQLRRKTLAAASPPPAHDRHRSGSGTDIERPRQCQLLVTSGHVRRKMRCPLYPQKRPKKQTYSKWSCLLYSRKRTSG